MNDRRSGNWRMLLRQPVLMGAILLIFAILFLFIALPLYQIARLSLTNSDGSVSLRGFQSILSNPANVTTFFNSMKLGLLAAAAATLIGFVFAFAVTRTEMKGKGFFKVIAMVPIISPPFVLSLAMIFLFGRQGLITHDLLNITDANVYGMHSLLVVQAVSYFPVAYMTLTGILESIDDSVEDSAYNMGASRGHIFRTITLPLALPGVISALLLTFIQSLEDFGNPAVIGGNFKTLSIEVYRMITGIYDVQGGAVLSIVLLLPTLAAFLLQKVWSSKKSYVTVTGKPTQKRRALYEPHIVWPLFAFCSVVSLFVILLYGTVIMGAFIKTWGVNYTFTLEHFTYVWALGKGAIIKTIKLACISAPIAGILGMMISYLTVRENFFGRRIMEFVSMLAFAIPGTVIGLSYIYSFNTKPLMLTGTATILVAAMVLRNMPVGIESGTATLQQIDKSIEEASATLGAGVGYTFRHITLPLLKNAFASGLVYSFVRAMTAVSSIIFLVSPSWNLITSKIFSLFDASKYSEAAAYIFVMIVVILAAIGVINALVDLIFNPRKTRAFLQRVRGRGSR